MRLKSGDEVQDYGQTTVVPHASALAPTAWELERDRLPRCGVVIEGGGESAACALWVGHDGAHHGFTAGGRSLQAGAPREERLERLRRSQALALWELREVVAKIALVGDTDHLAVELARCMRDARRLACSWAQVAGVLGVSADEAFATWKDVVG